MPVSFRVPNFFLIAIALCMPLCAHASENAERIIVVSGEGVVSAAPDMASLRLGVTIQAVTAEAALAENTERMTGVMTLLTEEGIETRDIQTSDFSVQPVYDRRTNGTSPEIIGYSVRNIVHVRLRALDKLGPLLDAVVTEGSNTLQGLTFGLSKPGALEKQAEAEAVTDALTRARSMAEAAGVSLGDVLRIEAVHGGAPRPQMEMMARAADSGPVPVAAGELSVRAQVRVTVMLTD